MKAILFNLLEKKKINRDNKKIPQKNRARKVQFLFKASNYSWLKSLTAVTIKFSPLLTLSPPLHNEPSYSLRLLSLEFLISNGYKRNNGYNVLRYQYLFN